MMLPSYFIQIGSKMCGVRPSWGIFNRKFMMRILNISWHPAQMQPIRTSSVLNMNQILNHNFYCVIGKSLLTSFNLQTFEASSALSLSPVAMSFSNRVGRHPQHRPLDALQSGVNTWTLL